MSYNHVLLDLDPTGKNPNNRIVDEPHSLSNRPTRSVVVNYGPFFAEDLLIHDGSQELHRGLDYQIVELHQEATLKYGKEIASVILIINSQVSSNVTVTYQALGGHYCYSDKSIANMYESVINDNRPVDWKNVFNKPSEFNPTIHRHLLDDVYGFEPIVDYLERIKRAITLGQVDIVLEILEKLLSNFQCGDLPKILPSNKLIQYDAFLFFLSRRKMLYNIWADKKDCDWVKGTSQIVQVDTSGYPVGTTLYWELYKPDLNIVLFSRKSGMIKATGGIVDITLYIPSYQDIVEYPLYLGIKEHPTDIDYKAVTYRLEINEHVVTDSGYGPLLQVNQDSLNRYHSLQDISTSDELRAWYMLSYY